MTLNMIGINKSTETRAKEIEETLKSELRTTKSRMTDTTGTTYYRTVKKTDGHNDGVMERHGCRYERLIERKKVVLK